MAKAVSECVAKQNKQIDLRGSIFRKMNELPPDIAKLTSVTACDLSMNHIPSLPNEIGEMMNLEVLSLDYNELKELNAAVCQLKMLRKLSVRGNKLVSLPESISNLTLLEELDVRDNALVELPLAIGLFYTYGHGNDSNNERREKREGKRSDGEGTTSGKSSNEGDAILEEDVGEGLSSNGAMGSPRGVSSSNKERETVEKGHESKEKSSSPGARKMLNLRLTGNEHTLIRPPKVVIQQRPDRIILYMYILYMQQQNQEMDKEIEKRDGECRGGEYPYTSVEDLVDLIACIFVDLPCSVITYFFQKFQEDVAKTTTFLIETSHEDLISIVADNSKRESRRYSEKAFVARSQSREITAEGNPIRGITKMPSIVGKRTLPSPSFLLDEDGNNHHSPEVVADTRRGDVEEQSRGEEAERIEISTEKSEEESQIPWITQVIDHCDNNDDIRKYMEAEVVSGSGGEKEAESEDRGSFMVRVILCPVRAKGSAFLDALQGGNKTNFLSSHIVSMEEKLFLSVPSICYVSPTILNSSEANTSSLEDGNRTAKETTTLDLHELVTETGPNDIVRESGHQHQILGKVASCGDREGDEKNVIELSVTVSETEEDTTEKVEWVERREEEEMKEMKEMKAEVNKQEGQADDVKEVREGEQAREQEEDGDKKEEGKKGEEVVMREALDGKAQISEEEDAAHAVRSIDGNSLWYNSTSFTLSTSEILGRGKEDENGENSVKVLGRHIVNMQCKWRVWVLDRTMHVINLPVPTLKEAKEGSTDSPSHVEKGEEKVTYIIGGGLGGEGDKGDFINIPQCPIIYLRDVLESNSKLAKAFNRNLKSFGKSFRRECANKDYSAQKDRIARFLRKQEDLFQEEGIPLRASNGEETKLLGDVRESALKEVYDVIFSRKEDKELDEKFHNLIESLQWLEPKHLDINERYWDKHLWAAAQRELSGITSFTAPRAKLECIMNSCRVIFFLLNNPKQPGDRQRDPAGADEFFPLLVYVIVKARTPRLRAEFQYISRFASESELDGEMLYYFTHVMGAMAFVENIKAANLNISVEEFKSLMDTVKAEREHDKQKTSTLPEILIRPISLFDVGQRSPRDKSLHTDRNRSASPDTPSRPKRKKRSMTVNDASKSAPLQAMPPGALNLDDITLSVHTAYEQPPLSPTAAVSPRRCSISATPIRKLSQSTPIVSNSNSSTSSVSTTSTSSTASRDTNGSERLVDRNCIANLRPEELSPADVRFLLESFKQSLSQVSY